MIEDRRGRGEASQMGWHDALWPVAVAQASGGTAAMTQGGRR
jgi:hypothetical protein